MANLIKCTMGLNKMHDKVSSVEFSGEEEYLLSEIKLTSVTPASSVCGQLPAIRTRKHCGRFASSRRPKAPSNYQVEGIRTSYEDEHNGATFSIMTQNGEVYDCVDFYKQPAFSNPLLKDLTFKAIEGKQAPNGIGLKDGGCPTGTVPILRTKQRGNHHKDLHPKKIISPQEDPLEPYHCYAIVRTSVPSSRFFGAGGAVSIYNPTVGGHQFSASRMRLSNGLDSIEVGWMVNQDLFQDPKTHLYVRFVAAGKSCFNLECPGFVLVGKAVSLGIVPDKVSHRGYDLHAWQLYIDKHKGDGNWWVSIGPINKKYDIGYWPKSLFTSLADVANQVDWGGEVYNPPETNAVGNNDKPPQMGCGNKPDYDPDFAAFYMNTTLLDENFHVMIPPKGTIKYMNCDRMYTILDAGYQGDDWGRLMLFGGPAISY